MTRSDLNWPTGKPQQCHTERAGAAKPKSRAPHARSCKLQATLCEHMPTRLHALHRVAWPYQKCCSKHTRGWAGLGCLTPCQLRSAHLLGVVHIPQLRRAAIQHHGQHARACAAGAPTAAGAGTAAGACKVDVRDRLGELLVPAACSPRPGRTQPIDHNVTMRCSTAAFLHWP